MALTRKFLSALGIDGDKIDEIINAHSETVEALKKERDAYKEDAGKLPAVTAERDELKAAAEKSGKDPFKVKYEAIKEEFDAYKKEAAAKETREAKNNAYRALLKEAGVSEKRIDAVLRVSDVDGITLDKDGKVEGADKLVKSIKEEWADFISADSTKGAQTATPPQNNGGSLKTREEIYATDEHGRFKLDASQRQAALAEILNTQKG